MERRSSVVSRTAKLLWRWAVSRVISQKDYETDEYGWITVTESNFDDVVIKSNKDVLIVFHTVPDIPGSSAYI